MRETRPTPTALMPVAVGFLFAPGGRRITNVADEQTQAVTNEVAPATTPQTTVAAQLPAQDAEDINALPSWAQRIIGELRKESASHRKAKTEAEKAALAQQEQAAKEQGKWQELATKYEPQAKRAADLEAFVVGMVEEELKAVPERVKPLVPAFDDPLKTLEWVRNAKAAGVLATPQPPRTDAGEGATGGKPRMSEQDKRLKAAALGVDWRYLPD
jgi:hypothetical protein